MWITADNGGLLGIARCFHQSPLAQYSKKTIKYKDSWGTIVGGKRKGCGWERK